MGLWPSLGSFGAFAVISEDDVQVRELFWLRPQRFGGPSSSTSASEESLQLLYFVINSCTRDVIFDVILNHFSDKDVLV